MVREGGRRRKGEEKRGKEEGGGGRGRRDTLETLLQECQNKFVLTFDYICIIITRRATGAADTQVLRRGGAGRGGAKDCRASKSGLGAEGRI